MMCVPRVIFNRQNNTEYVQRLISELEQFKYYPLNTWSIIQIESVLRELSNYVSLLGFTENGELGTVNITATITNLKWRNKNRKRCGLTVICFLLLPVF